MAFMNTIQLLCRNITAIILLSFTAMFASCDNDDDNINEEPLPEEPQPVERTILAYIWGDIDGESGLVLSWIISIKWRQDGTTVMQEAFMFTLIRRPCLYSLKIRFC